MNTTTFYHSRIRYFTSPSLHRAVVEVEMPGEVNSLKGSGRSNHIETVSNDSAIVGGENNLLGGGDQRYSFIGSGLNNIISSPCASIIGGAGNTIPAGMPNTHIAGSGITAVVPNTLHANCFYGSSIPNVGTPGPTGTFAWKAGNLLGPTDKVLVWI